MKGTGNDILYYPYISFVYEDWVKKSLLFWNHVYRITPSGYHPTDERESINTLLDNGLIRNITPTDSDRRVAGDSYLQLLDAEWTPSGLNNNGYDFIHEDKIDNRLYPILDQLAEEVFRGSSKWKQISKSMARGYMFTLADTIANRRNWSKGTDDIDAWSVSPYFTEGCNWTEIAEDPTREGVFTSVLFNEVLPNDVSGLTTKQIVDFASKRKDEKALLRNKMNEFAAKLPQLQSEEEFKDECGKLLQELDKAKKDYRRSWAELLKTEMAPSFLAVGGPYVCTIG